MRQERDEFRIQRLKDGMAAEGVDYLVLRLPENVLYATGYWPIFGASMAVFPRADEPAIFYIEGEERFVAEGWVADARAYRFFDLDAIANPNRDFARMLRQLWQERGFNERGVIGYEGSFELVAANNIGAEVRVPAEAGRALLAGVFPDAQMRDCHDLIRRARTIKSAREIEAMRIACDCAGFGYAAGRDLMIPGVRDCEVSGAVEGRIYGKGVGYRGVRRARGFCFSLSGPHAAMGENPYFISSDRPMERGDVALVELDTFADGYFCDMSRTFSVGAPTARAQEIWGIVNEALEAMLGTVRPGTLACEVYFAGERVVQRHGFQFVHGAHGIGMQFHEAPALHPKSEEVLERGMVLSLEPHVYIPGWGGVRIEENVAVTGDGYDLLTIFPRGL